VGEGRAERKKEEDMCVAAAHTKNRGDGGAPMDSVEGKQSQVIGVAK
jgi:hypothetical protein